MKLIRKFNNEGIEKFREYLNEIRNGGMNDIPSGFVNSDTYSEPVEGNVSLDFRVFDSKEKLIKYLHEKVHKIKEGNIFYNEGMWTWLSAFYFDSVCPLRTDDTRKPGKDSRHILNGEEWNRYYRHLLASPVRLYHELKEYSVIYLQGSPDIHGDLFEQLAARQEVASCKGIIEAATLLYWDKEKKRIKKNARDKEGAGVLRRFAGSTIWQFKMTYDLNSMNGTEIITLLPEEYNSWKVAF